jgi:hypothetical protein
MKSFFTRVKWFLILFLLVCGETVSAQALLQKVVRVNADNAPLSEVLKSIGEQGGFTFSYNSNAVAGKRLVAIHAPSITVEKALDELLKGTCTYKEVGNHIVLTSSKEKYYLISGYVLDAANGQGLAEASVYESNQLVGTITNSEGYFRLKLRNQYPTADISISKYLYQDTTVFLASAEDHEYRLPVRAATRHELNEVTVSDKQRRFSDNFLSRLFANGDLKDQTRNIGRAIAERPVQSSFVPGLGTHGKIGAQVVNKFSLNILGGYTAGVNGFELAGLFNIDQGDVRYCQIAGLFNLVGGEMEGLQIGGLSNTVQDTVTGVQIAGINNFAGDHVEGLQLSGVANVAVDSVDGMQTTGVVNTAKHVNGMQLAGVANVSVKEIRGMQLSGVFNFTHRLKGFQLGLINWADTSEGLSLGLINYAGNGYHKFAVYSDEVVPMNAAVKTGMPALYTILFGGWNPGQQDKVVTFGAGLGNQARFSSKWSLTTEATVQHLYLGEWDDANLLYRLRLSICYQPNQWISIFTGPSINGYQNFGSFVGEDYLQNPADKGFWKFKINDTYDGWFGWQVGVAFF